VPALQPARASEEPAAGRVRRGRWS
jgi:hypothetical protein